MCIRWLQEFVKTGYGGGISLWCNLYQGCSRWLESGGMFAIFSLPLLYFFFGLVVCDVSICLTSTLVAEGWEWRGWCWEHQVTHYGGGDQRLVTILPTCFTCHTIPNIYVDVAYLTCRRSSCGCWSCYSGDGCQSGISHVKATFEFVLCWNLSSHELYIVIASSEMNLSFVLCWTCQLT